MAKEVKPKEYKIPSRNWGITADEAGDVLMTVWEIEQNKPLHKAALANLRARKKAISNIV